MVLHRNWLLWTEGDQVGSGINDTAKSWPAACGQVSGLGGVRNGVDPSGHKYRGELRSCEIIRIGNKQSHHWGKGSE